VVGVAVNQVTQVRQMVLGKVMQLILQLLQLDHSDIGIRVRNLFKPCWARLRAHLENDCTLTTKILVIRIRLAFLYNLVFLLSTLARLEWDLVIWF